MVLVALESSTSRPAFLWLMGQIVLHCRETSEMQGALEIIRVLIEFVCDRRRGEVFEAASCLQRTVQDENGSAKGIARCHKFRNCLVSPASRVLAIARGPREELSN